MPTTVDTNELDTWGMSVYLENTASGLAACLNLKHPDAHDPIDYAPIADLVMHLAHRLNFRIEAAQAPLQDLECAADRLRALRITDPEVREAVDAVQAALDAFEKVWDGGRDGKRMEEGR